MSSLSLLWMLIQKLRIVSRCRIIRLYCCGWRILVVTIIMNWWTLGCKRIWSRVMRECLRGHGWPTLALLNTLVSLSGFSCWEGCPPQIYHIWDMWSLYMIPKAIVFLLHLYYVSWLVVVLLMVFLVGIIVIVLGRNYFVENEEKERVGCIRYDYFGDGLDL